MDPLEEELSRKYVGRRVKNHTLPFGENEFVIFKIDCTSFVTDEAMQRRTVVFLRSFRGVERHIDLHVLLHSDGRWELLGLEMGE